MFQKIKNKRKIPSASHFIPATMTIIKKKIQDISIGKIRRNENSVDCYSGMYNGRAIMKHMEIHQKLTTKCHVAQEFHF
jgi:hypothetical protein